MTHHLALRTPVAPAPPARLPAERHYCACGKDGSAYAHGHNAATGHRALTCTEIAAIRRRAAGAR